MPWFIDRTSISDDKGRAPLGSAFFTGAIMIPELVIFDCDGVLVDSEGPTNQLLRDDLKRFGLVMSHADVME
jgi:hypothetical protein